ncbi:MAG: CRTAC1 family protein [Verrucomicrobiae bacterium]|nr:CRTAC1 family protein [Verrucomicrobiae bacterium]
MSTPGAHNNPNRSGVDFPSPAFVASSAFCLAILLGCSDESHLQSAPPPTQESAASVEALAAERSELDSTVFASEVDAQHHEQVIVQLWDEMRKGNAFAVLTKLPFSRLVTGEATPQPPVDWGVPDIHAAKLVEPRKTLDHGAFVKMLQDLESAGWHIAQTEWHHTNFVPATETSGARSLVSFEVNALFRNNSQRVIVRGKLNIAWKLQPVSTSKPEMEEIDALGVELFARKGSPAFTALPPIDPKIEAPGSYPSISPLIVRDLDGDGLSEIVMVGCNLLYRNTGNFTFTKEAFLAQGPKRPSGAGIIADFTGDGIDDFVGGSLEDGSLQFFAGTEGGHFSSAPRISLAGQLSNLQALTAGDIDGDGDLDLYVGQWKAPYAEGAMPTPYYDANDGKPDYLLANGGEGNFTDITEAAGFANSRTRRTFSASLVDLNDDRLLDLVQVADFSGLHLHENKGDGTFVEVTDVWVDEHHGFGMSHRLDDFDGDGRLDLYMVGMSSTTARRLDSLGVGRPGFEHYEQMRAPMSFGNRLYLRRENGHFEQNAYTGTAARTGWSWGCTSADFDLDGDPDIYVANGHLSGDSAKDYCTRYWCHDIYTGNSKPNPVLDSFFSSELGTKLGREFSWNGFEHNVLFLNRPNEAFFNASFLLGSAFEFDSRSIISEDLDNDGKPDLLAIEYRTETLSQRLHILRNQQETSNHWIGLHVPAVTTAMGATVRAKAGSRIWVKPVITGESLSSQHSNKVHFGLGQETRIDSVEIQWSDGKTTQLENPGVDQYHSIAREE